MSSYHPKAKRTNWSTPQWLFDLLHARFKFTLDVCAEKNNAKCRRYFSPKANGLEQNWSPHRCWMNPPFGEGIAHWVLKAKNEAYAGALVVCLLPVRSDTFWWHNYLLQSAHNIYFVRGRLKFDDGPGKCPFPVAVVVFRKGSIKGRLISSEMIDAVSRRFECV